MLQEGDSLPVVAPSLLTGIPITSTSSRYSLGMDDWVSPSCSPEPSPLTRKRRIEQREEAGLSSSPPPRRKQLSLAKKSSQRWEFLDECAEGALSKKYVLKNTEATTKWALSNFMDWKSSRNSANPEMKVPDTILQSTDTKLLSKWLSLYAAET